MFYVIIFFLLGLCFGFAARLPWALLAFIVPGGLALVATDRDPAAVVLYLVVTAVGILAGLVLAVRSDEQHA